MDNIGQRLASIRLSRNETLEQAAESVGITYVSLSRYENGHRMPKMDILSKLAAHYGVTVDYLMNGDTPQDQERISDADLRFALWGGDAGEITQAQLDEVKRFAQFVRERDKK